MQWVEYDNWDPQALLQIKQSTSTRLASCESLVTTRQYRPFLELHAMDVCDHRRAVERLLAGACRSGGWPRPTRSTSRRTTTTATWPTCTRSHLCAVLPNVRIMEIDIDDVPWKAELVDAAARDQGRAISTSRQRPAGARTSTRRCCARTRGRGRGGEARVVLRDVTRADGRAAQGLTSGRAAAAALCRAGYSRERTRSAKSSMTRYCRFRGGYSMIWRRPCALERAHLIDQLPGIADEAGGLDQVGGQEAGLLGIDEAVVAARAGADGGSRAASR